jgi:hypothetical protein
LQGADASSSLPSRSIWNFANAHTLVIVTANVSPGTSDPSGGQLDRIDVEIVDGSHKGNVYLAKKVGLEC